MPPTLKVCRHCHKCKVNRPRGLCWHCYYAPGVKDLYPSTSKYARRGIGNLTGISPLPAPTMFPPGTPERIAEVSQRALRGEALNHPKDADWSAHRFYYRIKTMRTIVLYHGGGCSDGFCAAWLFSKAYPAAEFIACNYGDPVPDVYGARVFVLDFSWKRRDMIALLEKAAQVIVLDHHPTAQDELAGLASDPKWESSPTPPEIVFDMEKSGARLAYEWLVEHIVGFLFVDKIPKLVEYVEDRDLWRFKLPSSKAVNAAIRSYPLEFPVWDSLAVHMESAIGGFVAEGQSIERAQSQTIASHVKNARVINIGGHNVLAVNTTTLHSEIAAELAAGRLFGAVWFDKIEDDGRWTRIWSLRVRDGDFDVSTLAKQFGGGGHKKAAGFQTDLVPGMLKEIA